MRCCEAWEPVGKCFDPISFECIDFRELSQIIASLTRENLAERAAGRGNLCWTQTEKTVPWRNADLDFVLAAPRNQCSAFTLLPTKTAIPWKTNMNQAGDYVSIGVQSLRHALKAKGTIIMKTFCHTFRKASDDIRWEIDRNEFDELMATKKGFRTASTDVRED